MTERTITKRIWPVLVASTLALASCGDSGKTPEGAATDLQATGPAILASSEEIISAAACGRPGDVSIRLWDEQLAPIVEAAASGWVGEHCPGADVTVNVTPWNDYWPALEESGAPGQNVDDIVWMSPVLAAEHYERGLLLNLADRLDSAGINPHVWGSLADSYTFDGEIHALPINWDTVVIAYNAELFAEAGAELPAAGWTWDDYAAAGALISALGDDLWGAAGYHGWQTGYGGWLASAGVEPIVSADGETCTLTDPASIETFEFFHDLIRSGVAPTPDDLGGPQHLNEVALFGSGRLGMTTVGSWMLDDGFDQLDFEWGVVTMPANPTTGTSRSISNAIAYAIHSGSDDPDLAFDLLRYLVSDAGGQYWIDERGLAPANPSPSLRSAWVDRHRDLGVDAAVFVDALDGAQALTAEGLAAWDTFNGELERRLFTLSEPIGDVARSLCAVAVAGR